MKNEWWMRPALQKSEAVLLPALERRKPAALRIPGRCLYTPQTAEPFRPVDDSWGTKSGCTALSTYVRPRGSMAGRSVLRAAGIRADPYTRRTPRLRRRF